MLEGDALRRWLAGMMPDERDAAVEAAVGLSRDVVEAVSSAPPGPHLVGHHMLGVDALVRALDAVPVRASDVVVDLGAGLGKVVAFTRLLTGARTRGIEIQPTLVAAAVTHSVELGDARTAPLADATVVLLYCPFDGSVLAEVAARLDAGDAIVCAFGVDLPLQRLRPRPSDDFWTTIWDPPRPPCA